MSLAGFDLVVEIAQSALEKLVKANMVIDGEPANPPFEMTVPLTGVVDDAFVHVIVDDLQLDLQSDDTATLTFTFSNTSVVTPVPGPTITQLTGTVIVNAPLQLVVAAQTMLAVPIVNLTTASVTVAFTNDATSKLSAGLSGTGVTVAQFTGFATTSVTSFIQTIGAQSLGSGYNVVPGSDGTLSPLRFERLELHCIVGSGSKRAVGLFGILFAANTGNGNTSAKTTPAIAGGRDTCVSLSPSVFHRLVFCPGIASNLGVPVSALPTSCGSNLLGVSVGGTVLNKITDGFASGKINIDLAAHKSGFCYEADAKIHGQLTIAASGNTLTPTIAFDEPEVDVSIDWYCGPAGGIAIGLTAVVGLAITNALAESVATDIAAGALDGVVGTGLQSSNLGIAGVDFDLVTIVSDRMTIHGNAVIPMPLKRNPALTLVGSVTTSSTTQVSSGTYTALAPLCLEKDFPYAEIAQQQVATFQAVPTLLALPLTLEWWILAANGTTVVDIPPTGGGTTHLTQTLYALPLPAGTYVDQVVHIDCSVSDDVLQLTNDPAEGNFWLSLFARATDPAGQVIEILNPGFSVHFVGNIVELGGGYQEWYAECAAKAGRIYHKFSESVDVTLTPWVPVDHPEPERLLDHFITLATSNHPSAPEGLLESLLAHGSSTFQALQSAAAQQVGKQKANEQGFGQ